MGYEQTTRGQRNPMQDSLQQNLGGTTSNTMPVGVRSPMEGGPYQTPGHQTLTGGGGEKRDQWSGAGKVSGGNFGNVEGFDQKNWDDPNMQTAKYQAGRIFSRYDPNDAGALDKILADAEFKGLFGNAKGMGPDKIDFGDGRPVDIIRGHGAPGAKFSWQTEDAPGGAAAGPATGGSVPAIIPGQIAAGQESDLMAQLMAALQEGQQEPDPQALLQQQLR